jgi:hypothetical protein
MFEEVLNFLGIENRISNGGSGYEVVKFKRNSESGKSHVFDFYLTRDLKSELGTIRPGDNVKLKFEMVSNKGWAKVELLGLAH